MKIDLTCPVELWQYAMPSDEHGECTFVMNNLSDKVVTSVQVTLNCFDKQDELLFRQTEREQGLKAGVGERFTVVILPSEWKDVEGVDLVIEKVWFDDATIWRKGNAPLAHYVSNAIAPGRALDDLRFVAGKDAMGYPQLQEEVWMCVCGRANALDAQRCCRCERRRDAVFASFSRENVSHVIAAHEQKLAQAARKAREENNILQENQEKRRVTKRRRRKQAARLGISLAVVAALAAAAVFWGIPTVKYKTAQDLLRDGHYEEAAAAFAEMGDYKESARLVLECDYQKANKLLEAGDEASLLQAKDLYAELTDYQNSAENIRKADYALGLIQLKEARFDEAIATFAMLGDYEQSAEKGREALYGKAKEQLAQEAYAEARSLFAELGDYEDASAQVQSITYILGKKHMEAEAWDEALAELATLGSDYEDVARLMQKIYYAQAEKDLSDGAYESAGEKYLLAGDYGDAKAKANDCLYRLAQEIKAGGDYTKAAELFLQIPDYLDAEGQAQLCVQEQAADLMKNEEYAAAAELLKTIPANEAVQELLDECSFKQASALLDEGNAEQAEALLSTIVEYKGADAQLKKVRYQLAEADFDAGKYEDALARYEQLGSYRTSAARRKQCKYAMADAALTAAQYDAAIAGFTELGSYKQSKDKLEEAQYQKAMALRQSGDTEAAVAAFTAMGSSKRAKQALKEISMDEAKALFDAGKFEEAAALYKALDGDEAEEQYKACQYQLAVEMRKNGDLIAAAEAFHKLGRYQDAKEQSESCYAEYYGPVADAARNAMENQDYRTVIQTLRGYEMSALSKAYDDLPDLFNEACYELAEQLYREGKPYEAIPYYQAVGDYRDTQKEKLGRRVYLILGDWQSATGKTATFRMDGTCDLMGETLYYRVSNFSLYTGLTADDMTVTHKLSAISENGMSLRDIRDGQDVVYKFSRVGEFNLPAMELPEDAKHAPES